MFFEGAEKKVELIVSKEIGPLRERPFSFWEDIVSKCEAKILSSISNNYCDAYLLSESSLFIWNDRLLMLTCGQTKLISSVMYIVEELGEESIKSIIFQRKNEYQSELQKTTFYDDLEKLSESFNGKALRFGKLHSHHNLLFHLNLLVLAPEQDKTTELLIYDISVKSSDFLTQKDLLKKDVRSFLKLETIFKGFEIDDFLFTPFGYSLNAIKDHFYITIHITPEKDAPYVSFETNLSAKDGLSSFVSSLLNSFEPGAIDVVSFNEDQMIDFGEEYQKINHVQEKLTNGHNVNFRYFIKKQQNISAAERIFSKKEKNEI